MTLRSSRIDTKAFASTGIHWEVLIFWEILYLINFFPSSAFPKRTDSNFIFAAAVSSFLEMMNGFGRKYDKTIRSIIVTALFQKL